MNLLLFTDVDRLDSDTIQVTDRRRQHLAEVHNAAVGDSLRIGEVGGKMGSGELLSLDNLQATIAVSVTDEPPPKQPIQLVLALPRPKMLRRILRTVAELGVAQLHLINSYRVEKSYWQSPVLGENVIRDYLLQGLEQAQDTILPAVSQHQRFKPFVEDTLPGLIVGREALLAHPGDYPPVRYGPCTDTTLIIGPEGGFIPYEVEKLQQAGCSTVSFGPRILRVENAINSLLGRLL